MNINTAKIQFNENGNPIASDFDDVYFSEASGLKESEYVFIENNQIGERWLSCSEDKFVIAETGFGTGLNALVTFDKFLTFRLQNPEAKLQTLYFITTEKYPLTLNDLRKSLIQWPSLAYLVAPLIEQYPVAVEGCHRLILGQGALVLDLWLGDLMDTLPCWYSGNEGLVDAWYLDGFAPSKNPEMWTERLFFKMAGLAKEQCTFATFTAAGFVKRGLRQAGFTVEKRNGFGKKRDMLAGIIEPLKRKTGKSDTLPYYRRTKASGCTSQPSIAIIGAGLAGANIAFALAQKGLTSNLYCKESSAAQGASGNPQAGFYPQLNAEPSITSQVQALSFLFARSRYQTLIESGYNFDHEFCGVIQLGFNSKVVQRQHNLVEKHFWPSALIDFVSAQQTENIAGVPLPYSGLNIPLGGWINPVQLVEALLGAAQQKVGSQLNCEKTLVTLTSADGHWKIGWDDGSESISDIVILAAGSDCQQMQFAKHLQTRLVRGQVEAIPSHKPLDGLNTVLCHKGYLTPAYRGKHALGSTYIKKDTCTDYRPLEQSLNLAMQSKALDQCEWAQDLEGTLEGRAAIRCTAPDHLPIVGAIPDFHAQQNLYHDLYKALPSHCYPEPKDHSNLFVLTGLGSRGLTTSALMAELLTSQILGHPLPLPINLLNALNPNRFLVKDLIRRTN